MMTGPVQTDGRFHAAWLCGGYEPGCDGVGDYVRRMAGALHASRAVDPTVVALRDGNIRGVRETGGVLRLPAAAPWLQTIDQAADFLDRCQPAVLAWNFVPQMFALRGIISAEMAATYAQLRDNRRLVLFLHELWCGTGREDTMRNWMTGAVQRPGILRWLEFHEPERVLTSNAAYAAVLRHYGVEATVVPLCGNIPRRGGVDRSRWPEALATGELAMEPRAAFILGGVFGAIHPIWEPEPALTELAAHARLAGKKLAIVWFGRGSVAAEEGWRRVADALESHIRFVRVGPLPESSASELLESCDLGLPTIQFNLLGKSGTAAAFREHGVPLLVVSDAWSPRFPGFERAAAVDSIVLWTADAKIDWEKLVASRPAPGAGFEECVGGWRRALEHVKGPPTIAALIN